MKFDPLAQTPDDASHKLVGFVVGNVQYGVDIMMVREIINPLALIPIPAAPPFILGMSDHREAVVPIVSLRLRFGLEEIPGQKRTKWILIRMHGKNIGIVVDRVTKVIGVTMRRRKKQHPLVSFGDKTWVKNVFEADDGLVFELDPDAVVGLVADFVASEMTGSDYFDE